MFELNGSYSDVQKTKTKTANRSRFWLPKVGALDETIEERCRLWPSTNKFSKQRISNFCKSRTGHLFANCRSGLFVCKFGKLLFRTTILQFVIQYNLFFAKCGKRFISNIAFKVWLKAVHGVVWGILSTLRY